jgi:hypothetical protein
MAAPRALFDDPDVTFDEQTIIVTPEEGPDVRNVMHPTAAMMMQVAALRAETSRLLDETGGIPPLYFLTLALADAFIGTRELLLRVIEDAPDAYRLAETFLAIGFDGIDGDEPEPMVESLRLDVSQTLDEVEEGMGDWDDEAHNAEALRAPGHTVTDND